MQKHLRKKKIKKELRYVNGDDYGFYFLQLRTNHPHVTFPTTSNDENFKMKNKRTGNHSSSNQPFYRIIILFESHPKSHCH